MSGKKITVALLILSFCFIFYTYDRNDKARKKGGDALTKHVLESRKRHAVKMKRIESKLLPVAPPEVKNVIAYNLDLAAIGAYYDLKCPPLTYEEAASFLRENNFDLAACYGAYIAGANHRKAILDLIAKNLETEAFLPLQLMDRFLAGDYESLSKYDSDFESPLIQTGKILEGLKQRNIPELLKSMKSLVEDDHDFGGFTKYLMQAQKRAFVSVGRSEESAALRSVVATPNIGTRFIGGLSAGYSNFSLAELSKVSGADKLEFTRLTVAYLAKHSEDRQFALRTTIASLDMEEQLIRYLDSSGNYKNIYDTSKDDVLLQIQNERNDLRELKFLKNGPWEVLWRVPEAEQSRLVHDIETVGDVTALKSYFYPDEAPK